MANRTRPIIMRLAVTEYEKELIERKDAWRNNKYSTPKFPNH